MLAWTDLAWQIGLAASGPIVLYLIFFTSSRTHDDSPSQRSQRR